MSSFRTLLLLAMKDNDSCQVSTYAAAHFTPEFLKAGARVDSDCLKEAFRLLGVSKKSQKTVLFDLSVMKT